MGRPMCESCGMPLKDSARGTEVDGTHSEKYCIHCYAEGIFVAPNVTVEEMRQYSIQGMADNGWPRFLAKLLTKNTHKLPRWQKADTSLP